MQQLKHDARPLHSGPGQHTGIPVPRSLIYVRKLCQIITNSCATTATNNQGKL